MHDLFGKNADRRERVKKLRNLADVICDWPHTHLQEPLDSGVSLEPDVEKVAEAVEEDVRGDEDADEHVDRDRVLARPRVVVDQDHQLHPTCKQMQG